jgi:hypothetical protein
MRMNEIEADVCKEYVSNKENSARGQETGNKDEIRIANDRDFEIWIFDI